MARNRYAHILSGLLLNPVRNFIRYGRIRIIFHLFLIFFLGKFRVFFRNRAFRHRHDCELGTARHTAVNRFNDFVDIVWNFRNQNDVRAACHTGIQRQPADFMPHDFHDENTSVRCRRRMNTVDAVRRNINRTLESESHIRSPQIVIDCLRERYDIQPFLS